MISLVFLICGLNECRTISPPDVFSSAEECKAAAYERIEANQEAATRGELPAHTALYTCHKWGDPA